MNPFFTLPPGSSDRLLRGLRRPQAGEASVWPFQTLIDEGLQFPGSGWGGCTYLVLEIDSENCLLAHNMLSTRQVPLMAER